MIEFETARLRVARWYADAPTAGLRTLLTPPVLQHLPEPLQDTSSVDDWIAARLAEGVVLAVQDRATTTLVGLLLLSPDMAPGERHLGYLLGEAVWGRGLASELVAGLVSAARSDPDMSRLVAGVGRDNPASARVLEKAGFTRDAMLSDPETDIFTADVRSAPAG